MELESKKDIQQTLSDLTRFHRNLRNVLLDRWNMGLQAEARGDYFVATLMYATVVEGVIGFSLREADLTPDSKGAHVGFTELIKTATEIGWLLKRQANDAGNLRDARNCVHPLNHAASTITFEQYDAERDRAVAASLIDKINVQLGVYRSFASGQKDVPKKLLGREKESNLLYDYLRRGRRLISITGLPGIGKSALAEKCVRTHAASNNLAVQSFHLTKTSNLASLEDEFRRTRERQHPMPRKGSKEADFQPSVGSGNSYEHELEVDDWVVIHNAELVDQDELKSIIRRRLSEQRNCHIVLTNLRTLNIETEVHIALGGIDFSSVPVLQTKSFELLKQHVSPSISSKALSDPKSVAEVKELLTLLEGVPLAIIAAAQMIVGHDLTAALAIARSHRSSFVSQAYSSVFSLLPSDHQKALRYLALYSDSLSVPVLLQESGRSHLIGGVRIEGSGTEEVPVHLIKEVLESTGSEAWIQRDQGLLHMSASVRNFMLSTADAETKRNLEVQQLRFLLDLHNAYLHIPGAVLSARRAIFADEHFDGTIRDIVHHAIEQFDPSNFDTEYYELLTDLLVNFVYRLDWRGLETEALALLNGIMPVASCLPFARAYQVSDLLSKLYTRKGSVANGASVILELRKQTEKCGVIEDIRLTQDLEDLYYREGDLDSAYRYAKEAKAKIKELPGNDNTKALLSRTLAQESNIARLRSQAEEAYTFAAEALELIRTLKPTDLDHYRVLAWANLTKANAIYLEADPNRLTEWWNCMFLASVIFIETSDLASISLVADRLCLYGLDQGHKEIVAEMLSIGNTIRDRYQRRLAPIDRGEFFDRIEQYAAKELRNNPDLPKESGLMQLTDLEIVTRVRDYIKGEFDSSSSKSNRPSGELSSDPDGLRRPFTISNSTDANDPGSSVFAATS